MKRIVYLSPVPLRSPSQRPHHFAQWCHERLGCAVDWVEPYPVRLPRWSDARRLAAPAPAARTALGPPWQDAPWLHIWRAPSLPVEPLPAGAALLGWLQRGQRRQLRALLREPDTWLAVGRPSGMALDLCGAQSGRRVLYDVMDDMAQFSRGLSQRWMRHAHRQMCAQAQVLWGSSQRIVQALEQDGRTAALVRNGTRLPPPLPAAVRAARADASRPLVLGYVGTLASWFDWQALAQLARTLPEARFPVYGPVESAIPAGLPPNVRLHGPVPHAEVFGLMQGWHAGLIPFVRNALTASVDPVKYYEYRAGGLPVLSTLFGEMPFHAQADAGVWSLADALALPEGALAERLRQWHAGEALHPAGMPDGIREAAWADRFEAGARHAGWLAQAS